MACQRETLVIGHSCLENYYRCEDSTCILSHYKCDGIWDCPDGSDEDNCTSVCRGWAVSVTDMPFMFCYDSCFPENCTCHALYYQCKVSGGCIPASRVCDGFDDCKGHEDELECVANEMETTISSTERGFVCYSGTHIPIDRVNDLIPDCPGSEAEDEMALQLYYRGDEIWHHTNDPIYARNCSMASVECIKGFPYACYPRDKICVYEVHHHTNVLMYCRNGAHLSDCEQHDCPSRYKCITSYCIPFHYICNGRLDCPGGEDEDNCAELKCQGLLRCRHDNVCVHPHQILDNITDCPISADDESLVHAAKCPAQCQCLGNAITCTGVDAGVLKQTSKFIKKIVFAQKKGLENIGLNFAELLFLDISNNSLRSKSLPKINSLKLQSLSLTFNGIELLTRDFLVGPVLHTLELQMNPLHTIAPASFSRLPNLKTLNLSGCRLTSVSKYTFKGLEALQDLDLSYNPLDDFQADGFSGIKASLCNLVLRGQAGTEWLLKSVNTLPNLCSIYVDTSRMCHYPPKRVACHFTHSRKGRCCTLVESMVLQIFVCLIISVLLGFNIVALLYWCKCKAKQIAKILMTVSNLCGLVWPLYLIYVMYLQRHYGDFFFLYEDSVIRSLHCKLVGVLFLGNHLLGLLTHLTLSYHHYFLIAEPFKDLSSVLLCYIAVCVILVVLPGVLFVYSVFGEDIFLTNPACHIYPIISKNVSYWYVCLVSIALTDVIFRSSTAALYHSSVLALKRSVNTVRSTGGTGKKKAASFKLKCFFVIEIVFLFISCGVQLLVALTELPTDYTLACIVVLMIKDVLNPVFHTFTVSNFRSVLFKAGRNLGQT